MVLNKFLSKFKLEGHFSTKLELIKNNNLKHLAQNSSNHLFNFYFNYLV